MIKNTFLRSFTLIVLLLVIGVIHSCAHGESRRENDHQQDSIRMEQQRREALERANRLLDENETEDTAEEEPDSLN